MENLSISHIDLDGIGCQIVLNNYFNITRMNINYNKIEEYLDILYDYCINSKPNNVFITDLSFTYRDFKRLFEIGKEFKEINFYFIDHHSFSDDNDKPIDSRQFNTHNFKTIISDKASATKLTYLYCTKTFNFKNNNKLKIFTDYINAYDIWLKDDKNFKVGLMLNELFWSYRINHFWNRFRYDFDIRNKDKDTYIELIKKKNKLFTKLEKSGRTFKLDDKGIFMIFVDDFRSHITLDYPNYKVYINFSSYGTLSVRINKELVLAPEKEIEVFKNSVVSELEKHPNINNAGGHIYAFGGVLKENSPNKQIEIAKFLLELIDCKLEKIASN